MREPTPLLDQLRWHRLALTGEAPLPAVDDPQVGWYQRTLTKGGVMVPVRIWLQQDTHFDTGELLDDEVLLCTVNGRRADAHVQWSYVAGNPITEEEFDYLTRRNVWAAKHHPERPEATPYQPVDFLTVPLPDFKQGEQS